MIQAYVNQDNIFVGNWEEGYAQPNCTAVSEPYYGDFKIPTWNGSEFAEGFIDTRTAEQILSDKIQSEKEKYIKRTRDGQETYAEISAEFRIAKLTGQITEEAHSAIEEILIPVRNEVLAGQWISGLNKLIVIGSEAIGQLLYDRLYNQMNNYILSSYTTEEINAERKSNVRK